MKLVFLRREVRSHVFPIRKNGVIVGRCRKVFYDYTAVSATKESFASHLFTYYPKKQDDGSYRARIIVKTLHGFADPHGNESMDLVGFREFLKPRWPDDWKSIYGNIKRLAFAQCPSR